MKISMGMLKIQDQDFIFEATGAGRKNSRFRNEGADFKISLMVGTWVFSTS